MVTREQMLLHRSDRDEPQVRLVRRAGHIGPHQR